MATNRSSCARAVSSLAPSGPETTGFPQLISIALIWPRPGVVISVGNSLSACAPATMLLPARRLLCGLAFRRVAQPQPIDIPGLFPAAAGTVHPAGDHIEPVAEPLG